MASNLANVVRSVTTGGGGGCEEGDEHGDPFGIGKKICGAA